MSRGSRPQGAGDSGGAGRPRPARACSARSSYDRRSGRAAAGADRRRVRRLRGGDRRVDRARPELKSPNDVLVGGRKVAGILAEAREERVVLGMGVNVNVPDKELPQEVDRAATSLLVETGCGLDRAELLAELLSGSSAATTRGSRRALTRGSCCRPGRSCRRSVRERLLDAALARGRPSSGSASASGRSRRRQASPAPKGEGGAPSETSRIIGALRSMRTATVWVTVSSESVALTSIT